MNLAEDFRHLSGKQWAVVIVGGVGVAWLLHRRAVAATANQATQAAADPSASAGYQEGAQGGPGDTPPGVGNIGDILPPAGQQYPIRTNAQWRVAAIRALIAAGNGPLASATAVARYLRGRPLNRTDDGLINQAIGLVGPPPVSVPIARQLPAAKHHHHQQHTHHEHHGHHHQPPAHHHGHRLHKVRRGDTLATIAAQHHTTPEHLAAANGMRHGIVREGQHVKVPAAPAAGPPSHRAHGTHTRRDTTGRG